MWQWDIKILLPDGETWFTLCTAQTPEAVGEIVRFLFTQWGAEQRNITIWARGK